VNRGEIGPGNGGGAPVAELVEEGDALPPAFEGALEIAAGEVGVRQVAEGGGALAWVLQGLRGGEHLLLQQTERLGEVAAGQVRLGQDGLRLKAAARVASLLDEWGQVLPADLEGFIEGASGLKEAREAAQRYRESSQVAQIPQRGNDVIAI